jgi:hypothetical protein
MKTITVLACLSFILGTVGCITSTDIESDEALGDSPSAVGSYNGLSSESVRHAALTNEASYRGELLGRALDGAAFSPALKSLLSTDTASDELMSYIVRCALESDESVSFTQGGVTRGYHGQHGIAPEWSAGACDGECRQWVSACVLAHVNYNHVSHPINLVAAPFMPDSDYAGYPHEEATYWGDIFASDEDQKRNACVNDATRLGRICGQDTVTCDGFLRGSGSAHALESCETTCRDELTDGGRENSTYYSGCTVDGATRSATLTVWRND